MEKIKKEIEVSKEASELFDALVKIVKVVKEVSKDGFQMTTDLPAIVVAAVAELPKAVEGLDKLPAEAKEDTGAFVKAAMLSASDLVELFKAPKV